VRRGIIGPLFLTSVLDGGEWSASRPLPLYLSWKRPGYPLNRRLDGSIAGLDAMAERKISWSCRESNTGRPVRSPSLYRLSYPASGHHPELYGTNSHPQIPLPLRFALMLFYSLRCVSQLVPFHQEFRRNVCKRFFPSSVHFRPFMECEEYLLQSQYPITWYCHQADEFRTFSHFIPLWDPFQHYPAICVNFHSALCLYQYLFRFVWNENIQYSECKRRPVEPILRHMNPVCIIACL
jgi:hypothetical protein